MNQNGRFYSYECMTDIKNQIKSANRPILGRFGWDHKTTTIDLRQVTHQVEDPEIKGDILYAKVKVLSTPKGLELTQIMKSQKDKIVFRPAGTGQLSPANKVFDYKLISVNAILAEDDAFKGLM